MRDIYFIVADGQAKGVVSAFFARDAFHLSLGTRPIEFDPERDILDVQTNDPGVFFNAPSLARSVLTTHRHLVILIDEQWENKKTPGSQNIANNLSERLRRNDWDEDRFAVIVICPELESWIWQDNPRLAAIFNFSALDGFTTIGDYLSKRGQWDASAGKPTSPKETLQELCRLARSRPDRKSYELVVSRANVSKCQDPAFQVLLGRLREWFPKDVIDGVRMTGEVYVPVNEILNG